MNDYKELVKQLRMFCLPCHGEEKSIGQSAADVIEHLQSKCERLVSDYEILAKMYAKANEELCVRTKERDAAVADLHLVANNCFEDYVFSACRCCKKNDTCNGQPATGCEFEWRGVQEDNT